MSTSESDLTPETEHPYFENADIFMKGVQHAKEAGMLMEFLGAFFQDRSKEDMIQLVNGALYEWDL